MMLIDTHCHIHEASYPLDLTEVLDRAHVEGVKQMICVGTNQASSQEAVDFAKTHNDIFASIGVHPHDASDGYTDLDSLDLDSKLVAIGEIGLDYFYTHSSREVQIKALEWQIDFALRRDLPLIFHVREAFDDFWPIIDNFHIHQAELHSFTDTVVHMEEAISRGFYIGVNGISTFTKNEAQQAMFAAIPLDRLLLETDAPFLTPVPFRGKVNEPAFVRVVAEHHARIRSVSFDEIAAKTTANARALFAL